MQGAGIRVTWVLGMQTRGKMPTVLRIRCWQYQHTQADGWVLRDSVNVDLYLKWSIRLRLFDWQLGLLPPRYQKVIRGYYAPKQILTDAATQTLNAGLLSFNARLRCVTRLHVGSSDSRRVVWGLLWPNQTQSYPLSQGYTESRNVHTGRSVKRWSILCERWKIWFWPFWVL